MDSPTPSPTTKRAVIVAIPRERAAGERRVSVVPEGVRALVRQGLEVRVEAAAGAAAGFHDAYFESAGARIVSDPRALLGEADLVLKVQGPSAEELAALRKGAALIALLRPLDAPELARALAEAGTTSFALELVPRITRAQAMDVLSSQATVAGYRAVLVAAERLPKMFPMMVTAAGTISPARVFVIGAGVAGLQAIATAKRLGAVVEAYDTRAAVAEQVASLGARFVGQDLEAGHAEDAGGYAREQSEDFYRRQRELMAKHAAKSDVVITTALVPGRAAPLLLDEAGVAGMRPGSIVVDLAAGSGGNCAGTRPGEEAVVGGVHILGLLNPASDLPRDASQMFSKNTVSLVGHLLDDGALKVDPEDEITRGCLLTHEGEVRNEAVRELLAGTEGGA